MPFPFFLLFNHAKWSPINKLHFSIFWLNICFLWLIEIWRERDDPYISKGPPLSHAVRSQPTVKKLLMLFVICNIETYNNLTAKTGWERLASLFGVTIFNLHHLAGTTTILTVFYFLKKKNSVLNSSSG